MAGEQAIGARRPDPDSDVALEPGPDLEREPGPESDSEAPLEPASGPGAAGAAGAPAVTGWVASQQLQRSLTIAMFACVSWSLAQALLSAGVSPAQAWSVFGLATTVFASGVLLGGRAEGRNYRKYTDYGLMDWLLLLVPIALVLRLLPVLVEDAGSLVPEIASWMDEPWRFWNAGLVWTFLLVFLVWDVSLQVAGQLGKLGFQPGEVAPSPTSPAYYDWLTSPYRFVSHAAAWRHLMWQFMIGGFILLLLTGLSLVEPEDLRNSSRAEVEGVILHVLLYYLLGLLLASQTSLDRLRTDWLRGGAAVQTGLARRWLGYGLALAGLALVLALLLPTSFSGKTADQLPLIWRWLWLFQVGLGGIFWVLGWVFGHLLALLLAPFMWLLPTNETGQEGAAAVAPQPTPVPDQPGGEAFPSLASRLVWSVLLYLVPGLLAVYAVWNTWRKRRAIWDGLKTGCGDLWMLLRDGVLDLVAVIWRFFGRMSPGLWRLAPDLIKARWARRAARRGGDGEAFSWLRLRGLGPRELIQYFYVSLVRRGEMVGWPRGKGQTAYEYSRELARRLPDRQAEVELLTEAYMHAKYSRRPVDDDDARRARRPWERLRSVLQTRRRAAILGGWLGIGKD